MNAKYTVTKIYGCTSLQQSVRHVMDALGADKEIYALFHYLHPRQGFPLHKHRTTNEWIVVYDADFDFYIEAERLTIASSNRATVVFVPIGVCHTIVSRNTTLHYAVIKDGLDDFYSC